MTGLLEAHRHSQSEAMTGRGGGDLAPRMVRRAEGFMLAHLDQPLAIEDVAGAAGVGARALQLAFRRFRDCTPMEFLRRARLERAHADLQAARPGDTVTDIAIRWGFAHFGRFAQTYRARYGQSPSQTLQDARAGSFVN
jgi:transcriptional regulator GlxA family with amidase domain